MGGIVFPSRVSMEPSDWIRLHVRTLPFTTPCFLAFRRIRIGSPCQLDLAGSGDLELSSMLGWIEGPPGCGNRAGRPGLLDNQGLARLQFASPPCQGDDHPGSVVASFRSLLGGPVEWVSDLNFFGGMKLSALFQFLSDRLGQPVVLLPGGSNGDTPMPAFHPC